MRRAILPERDRPRRRPQHSFGRRNRVGYSLAFVGWLRFCYMDSTLKFWAKGGGVSMRAPLPKKDPSHNHPNAVFSRRRFVSVVGGAPRRSGRIARRMKLRSAKVFSRWKQPVTGTWARLRILSALILTPGRTSFYFLNQPARRTFKRICSLIIRNNLKAYPILAKNGSVTIKPSMLPLGTLRSPHFLRFRRLKLSEGRARSRSAYPRRGDISRWMSRQTKSFV